MGTDILEKEKVVSPVVEQKLPEPVIKTADVLPKAAKLLIPVSEAEEREKKLQEGLEAKHAMFCRQVEEAFLKREANLIADWQARHAAECGKLQEAARAREKKLLAGLDAKHNRFHRDIEESFAQKEKKLVEDLQARYMAESRCLEQAAAGREEALLTRLAAVRRKLSAVVIAAVLSVVAIWNFKATPREVSPPVSPQLVGAGQALEAPLADASVSPLAGSEVGLTASAALSVVQVLPEASPAAVSGVGTMAIKTGNGGNFSGGKSSAK